MVDFQTAFNLSFGALSIVIGWFARAMWAAVNELQAKLNALEVQMPREYVTKSDYKDDIARVHELLDKIYEKLDGKADK